MASSLDSKPQVVRPRARIVRPKRAIGAETVRAIEMAVDEIVAAHGIEGLTLRRVATRAGVGMGAIYRFFRSREALLASWELRRIQRETAAIADVARRAVITRRPLAPTLRELVKRVTKLVLEQVKVGGEAGFLSSTLERQESLQPVVQVLASALAASPHARPGAAERASLAIRISVAAVAFSSMIAARGREPGATEADWSDEIAEMIARYLVDPAHVNACDPLEREQS